jgi:hypothetical protein
MKKLLLSVATSVLLMCTFNVLYGSQTEECFDDGSCHTMTQEDDAIMIAHTNGAYKARAFGLALTGRKEIIEIDNKKIVCDCAVTYAGVKIEIGKDGKIRYKAPKNGTVGFAYTRGKSLCKLLEEYKN